MQSPGRKVWRYGLKCPCYSWSEVVCVLMRNGSRHSIGGGVNILRIKGHCPSPVCVLRFLLCSDFYIHRTITNAMTFLVAAYVLMTFISNAFIVFLPWCKHKKGCKKSWKEGWPIRLVFLWVAAVLSLKFPCPKRPWITTSLNFNDCED